MAACPCLRRPIHRSPSADWWANRRSTTSTQVAPRLRRYLARTAPIVKGPQAAQDARAALRHLRLSFPIIAKPDVGWCGFGVRRLDDEAALDAYIEAYPDGETLLLQEYLDLPGEAGVFYVRWPDESAGRLLSFTVRRPPHVVGDGASTVRMLISADEGLRGRIALYRDLESVPQRGQIVPLSTVWSFRMGGCYKASSDTITPALEATFDAIASSMPDLHVARFDIRFESGSALSRGDFKIIEINGAGSEAIEFFDPAMFRSLPPIAGSLQAGRWFSRSPHAIATAASRHAAGARSGGISPAGAPHRTVSCVELTWPRSGSGVLARRPAARHYRWVAPTPETQRRVLARADRRIRACLRGIFGWSLPFAPEAIEPELLDLMRTRRCRRTPRRSPGQHVARFQPRRRSFLHSAYPTTGSDAVFFGPDTYRFARFIKAGLLACRSRVDGSSISDAAAAPAPSSLPERPAPPTSSWRTSIRRHFGWPG